MTEATKHESNHELGLIYNHEPKKVPANCPGGDHLPRGDSLDKSTVFAIMENKVKSKTLSADLAWCVLGTPRKPACLKQSTC